MRNTLLWLSASFFGLALITGVALAQAPAPSILHHTFDQDTAGWTGLGASANLDVTHEAANVRGGKGALRFAYNVKKGEFNAAILPVGDGTLARAKSFRFWVKADHPTTLGFAVQENGGGRYLAVFSVPEGRWQQVVLSPTDLTLSREKDDPKDPDGKLDLDQVNGLGIVDLSQFFAQAEGTPLADLFAVKTGTHTLYLSDLVVSEEPVPSGTPPSSGEAVLDSFARPQAGWLTVGGLSLAVATGKPLEGRGLQADYHIAPMKAVGMMRPLPAGRLVGTREIQFDVATARPTRLIVQLEEVSGGKYNALVDAPGSTTLKHIGLSYSDFTPADDSKDDNGKLDLDQVKQILILDASGLLDQADQDNTLWIGSLRAVR